MSLLLDQLIRDESFRSYPYKDTRGITTFGHGFTHLTEQESLEVLRLRVNTISHSLSSTYPWFNSLPLVRQVVIQNMAYQLGLSGLAKFKKFLSACESRNYSLAAKEGLDSLWAQQTPLRAKRLMKQLETGIIQE